MPIWEAALLPAFAWCLAPWAAVAVNRLIAVVDISAVAVDKMVVVIVYRGTVALESISFFQVAHTAEQLNVFYSVLPAFAARNAVVIFDIVPLIAALHTATLIAQENRGFHMLRDCTMIFRLGIDDELAFPQAHQGVDHYAGKENIRHTIPAPARAFGDREVQCLEILVCGV